MRSSEFDSGLEEMLVTSLIHANRTQKQLSGVRVSKAWPMDCWVHEICNKRFKITNGIQAK